jgi:hypothetical protein
MVQRQFDSLKNIDFIGDIHGFANELALLLEKMNYQFTNGTYRHPDGRKVVFVGDYVDRGPKILETLKIVRSMQSNGEAIALMGNHEYNMLGFFTQNEQGDYLRHHSINKIYQILDTLYVFKSAKAELESYLEWMLSLPLFFENEYFRAVHATWNQAYCNTISENLVHNAFQSLDNFIASHEKKNKLYWPTNVLLKGLEFDLPDNMVIQYGDFIKRDAVRVRWWDNHFNTKTYRSISVHQEEFIPDISISKGQEKELPIYSKDEKPVFFGHYWMQGDVKLLAPNICCLDYSIARQQKLVAYRFDGEKVLNPTKFVWVECCS